VESLVVAIGVLAVALMLCIRFVLPRDIWTEVMAEIIHDAMQGLWRLVFGPRKVQVVSDKDKRVKGLTDKKQR